MYSTYLTGSLRYVLPALCRGRMGRETALEASRRLAQHPAAKLADPNWAPRLRGGMPNCLNGTEASAWAADRVSFWTALGVLQESTLRGFNAAPVKGSVGGQACFCSTSQHGDDIATGVPGLSAC